MLRRAVLSESVFRRDWISFLSGGEGGRAMTVLVVERVSFGICKMGIHDLS